jgi:hypothetical protein
MIELLKRFIRIVAIITSFPIYTILGAIIVLIMMIDKGLDTIVRVYKLWYETFVEEH